jgi:hypothetical protein
MPVVTPDTPHITSSFFSEQSFSRNKYVIFHPKTPPQRSLARSLTTTNNNKNKKRPEPKLRPLTILSSFVAVLQPIYCLLLLACLLPSFLPWHMNRVVRL